ncbi:alpha, alpha-phosphotrehalase, partial [Lacticaseibacillus paracasei subsp. paracasei Lpp126]
MGFHNKVIYQLYPKSFMIVMASGVGDLRGIIDKIDYLKSLH